MSYIGKSVSVKRVRYTPQSTIPSNAAEGDCYYEDGTNASEGLYLYKNATWQLVVLGSVPNYNVVSKSAAYTLTSSDDVILADTTSAAFTLTLPAAASNSGKQYIIVKTNTTANLLTVDGNAAETINGIASVTIGNQYANLKIISDGTNWIVINQKNEVFAKYSSNVGQSMTDSAFDIIDFEDKEFDSHNAVTTGASWKFTAPISGTYNISVSVGFGSISWTAGEEVDLVVYKNGSNNSNLLLKEFEATGSFAMIHSGSTLISLNEGDYIDARFFHNQGAAINLQASGATVNISVHKI
jgi:hypothetical protein